MLATQPPQETHYKRALSIVERRDGPDHERVRAALYGLAALYRWQKRLDDIEPLYKRIISICEASFGIDDSEAMRAWDMLADYYRKRCRDAEADAIAKHTSSHAKRTGAERARGLSKTLSKMEKASDGKHPLLASSYKRLGDHYRQAEQWADAEHAYHRAVAFLEKGTDLRDLWSAHAGLAESYLRQGRMEEAEREYRRAVDAFRTLAAGRAWPLPLEVLDGLGAVYESTSRQDEAAAWKSQAAERRERMKASRKCL